MYLEIYTLHPTTMEKEWVEVIRVDSREEAEEIMRNSPDLHNLERTLVSISAPKKSRLAFLVISWCEFYR
jgi:hypothetical protein